ncbi:MAG: gliding motility-associated C-terminal domain-containing protein [Crocinitomicaceae bacterium]|jgi:gliding motility-associated-like protein|nr:gliding motility-associated C-terminal domain-containing protein [Crocinitomicaceae bacterium]MDP4722845.1 gliding motility-associated C-terminal domain-containing protein [Crocinitomicaceae bacterium]MDP4739865.1 gliding motility-associated C-terminal domain-containing protein [Crocinitomicaceae bacterium]MDP4798765.1 gliding motility-associated C-terminal domain-containing protein [Crocinitomicaceae bacterium]MDP4807456.1 gliding motility-associated C-terminal domain-containing protein [Cr
MTEKDNIKDLFAKGLQDHQVQVDPALWSSISSSIGAGAAKTGLGIFAKTLIGVAATTIVAGAVYLSFETKSQEVKKQVVKTPQETSKSKEDKERTSTQPTKTKPSFQTFHNNPLPLGCFDINDDDLFIPDFDAQNNAETTEVLAFTSTILPHAVPEVIPTQAQVVPQIAAPSQIQPQQETQAKKPTRISLPNIFTPNGDGQNETLQIDWGSNSVQDFSIVVLDTKNNVVFKSDSPDFNWDGSDLGAEKLPRGAYIYFVTGVLNGQKWQQSSSLQIQY